jgi:hypothetical protein
MSDETDPRLLTLSGIAHRCAEETDLFFRRESHDPRYCYELFRRAILHHNEHAWEVICTQYLSLVAGWVQRHPSVETSGEEVQYFANCAFQKMWASVTSDRFERFADLKSLLRYLQMCVHSVIIDYIRTADQASEEIPDEDSTGGQVPAGRAVEAQVLEQVHGQEIWRWLNARLHDEKERRVVYGTFILDLKPRELYNQFRDTFNDVDEVYRIKQNVVARLRRDPEFAKLFA